MSNSQQESSKTSGKKNRKFGFRGGFRKKKGKKQDKPLPPPKEDGDDSTVYSVNLEASSKASASQSALESTAVTTTVGDPIHVILLVMDPKTRRFELLQLEFDSAAAKVSDIFAQIETSATEPNLKAQTYEKLMNVKGDELLHSKYLAEYLDSAGIVIAVPSTTVETGSVIAKMANPILTNPKVHAMLASSGLDIPDLPAPVTKAETGESAVISSDSSSQEKKKTSKHKKFPPLSLFGVAALAVAIRLILKVHIHFTSPLGPGDILAPGRSRGHCGLARLSPFGKCVPMSFSMGHDGVFQVVKDGEVVYELSGKKNCQDGCVAGLVIGQDGRVKINGSRVKTTTRTKMDVKPWPFAEDVMVPKTFL